MKNIVGRRYLWVLVGLGFGFLATTASANKYFTKTDSDANVYVAPHASDIDQVAILPFKAPTELIGSSISDLFVTEMLRAGRYTLVERGQMSKVLSESELAMSGLSAAQAVQVGQMIGADGVIIGTVMEYGTTAYKKHAYPVVAVSVRLIDTKTSEVVWSVDLAERAESKKVSLSGHARELVHEAVSGLYQEWQDQKYTAKPRTRSDQKISSASMNQSVTRSAVSGVPPEKPQGFKISDFGLREVRLSWQPPVDSPSKFQVERAINPEGPFVAIERTLASRLQYLDKGSREEPLEDNTTYYYRLIAISKEGLKSEPSLVLESLTAPPPDPPREITVEAPSSRCVLLEWEGSESEGVVSYRVERALASDSLEYEALATTKKLSFKDGGPPRSELKDSTLYVYRVQAINRVKSEGPMSAPVEVTTLPLPVAVTGLTVVSNEVRCVPIRWDRHPDKDIVGYTLYRSSSEDGEYSILEEFKKPYETEFLDGDRNPGKLSDDTRYYYMVVAKNNVKAESRDSVIVSAVTRKVPPAVEGLSAEGNHPREIPLTWEPSPDEKVEGYEVWRYSPDEDLFEKIEKIESREVTAYLDRGDGARASHKLGRLADGTSYRYKVKAFNTAYALSEWSDEVSVRTKPAPEVPLLLAPSVIEPAQVTLNWVANPEEDIASYEVQVSRYPDRSFKQQAVVEVDGREDYEYVHTALEPGEALYYRIQALDEEGLLSAWSDGLPGQAKNLPLPPSEVLVHYQVGGADLSWSASETSDVVGYQVYKKSGFFNWNVVGTSHEPSYSMSMEDIGKKGTFAIAAVDKDGLESERSESVQVRGSEVLSFVLEEVDAELSKLGEN